jgi:4a-hydroxytetrahydrobiopterin dehydratase
MKDLHLKKCVPCEGGTKPLNRKEIDVYLKDVKAWKVIDDKEIQKNFTFATFKHALGFVNEVGDVAEFEGHHPDLNLHNWNKVTVTLSTHAIKGLSVNDFIMAAKIDQIVKENQIE